MKEINVNRENFPASFKTCKNLGQLIGWLEKFGENDKLFIVKMKLNGKDIDEEEEKLLDRMSINDVKEVIVSMSPIGEIMSQTMSSIIAMIQDLQLKSIGAAQSMRAESKIDKEIMENLLVKSRWIIDSLEEVFLTHVKGKLLLRHHSLWTQAEGEFTSILQCILQSYEISNVDFLADLLEYDYTDALELWEEVLEKEILDNPNVSNIFHLNNDSLTSDNGVDV